MTKLRNIKGLLLDLEGVIYSGNRIIEGSIEMLEVPYEEVKVTITPSRGIDVGAGKGETLDSVIYGGVVGLIFDGRNRPITLSKDSSERIDSLLNWSNAVDEYPKGDLF